ncbi:MAG: hypothetical protein ACOYNF_19240 [Rhodoferax sp.]
MVESRWVHSPPHKQGWDLYRERHYREFVYFLPYVQRFLYGEGRTGQAETGPLAGPSPLHVFRRKDISGLRLTLRPGQVPVELHIVHIDLYLFDDLDLVELNLEVRASHLPLDTVRDILFRFGRAYPSSWEESGAGLHNVHLAEWLGSDGQVLARSDTEHRQKYLGFGVPASQPLHFRALGQPAASAGAGPFGRARRLALPAD